MSSKTIGSPILLLTFLALTFLPIYNSHAQTANTGSNQFILQTDAVGPSRFLAVHGRRSIIQGYATQALEVWAYPLQIVRGYEVAFNKQGTTTAIGGASVLRTVTYEPEAITRTYVGDDFVVRERLFVPLNEPSAIITYSVESKEPLDVRITFSPILDLMWPGAIGGQSTRWNIAASAYVISEPSRQFSAFVGSSEIVTHDETTNSGEAASAARRYSFGMRVGGDLSHRSATVVIGLLDNQADFVPGTMQALLASNKSDEREAHDHYVALRSQSLQIVTPDASVNDALAWAEIALDQTWVCNPYLGCGSVAGYGPSRDARRPQYEWFFAGDALTTTGALLCAGQYDRARDLLLFILKYQDTNSGMIWHELSQSASFLDWANKYPYMFVHVDITFLYLSTVAQYVKTSGDRQFIIDHWPSVQSAYNYCKSLASAEDGLPRIPVTKEGGNEQDRLTDDLGLSISWLTASTSFAELAKLVGHDDQASEANRCSEMARKSIASRYWMNDSHRWIDGYNTSGKAVLGRGVSGISLVDSHILGAAQSNPILDQIASADFQTDWGTRSIASSSVDFDPDSYSQGSVWGIQTASLATSYWAEHRPSTAFPIWRSLLSWNTLDSLGHMHEVLAGDVYHQQTESVPEQTWSSAAFLSASIQGLLGLRVNSLLNQVTFAPHLPAEWNSVSVSHVRLPRGGVDFSLVRSSESLELIVTNHGDSFTLRFAPEIPFGSHLSGATSNGKHVAVALENHDQDTHAALNLIIPQGVTRCSIKYRGGVTISVPRLIPLLGDRSHSPKIRGLSYKGVSLVVELDADSSRQSSVLLHTSEKIGRVKGASLQGLKDGWYQLTIGPMINDSVPPGSYRQVEIVVELVRERT